MTSHCHGKTRFRILKKTSTKAIVQKEGRRRPHWTAKENDCHWRPKYGERWIKSEIIDNVRKAMWRQRRKHQPKLTISRMDALRAISEIETWQDVKIVTDDETQIACVYSPSAMVYLHRNQDMFGDGLIDWLIDWRYFTSPVHHERWSQGLTICGLCSQGHQYFCFKNDKNCKRYDQ